MVDPDTDERALIDAARNGDRNAFGQLVEHHAPRLLSLSFKMLASRSDAEDAVQDAFASAWTARSKFDGSRAFEPWLTTITLNKARDILRRRRAKQLFGGPREVASDPVERAPGPDIQTEDRLLLDAVRKGITRLPARLREPFVLVVLEGWSQTDAASVLGVSEKAVETRIYRARKSLKKKFGFD